MKVELNKFIIVGLGGFLGAILRYAISGWIYSMSKSHFPSGTLVVNFIGCLFLGFLTGISDQIILSPQIRLFISIGVLGALTTFSTFSYETLMLIKRGATFEAAVYVFVSLMGGLFFAYTGYISGRALV